MWQRHIYLCCLISSRRSYRSPHVLGHAWSLTVAVLLVPGYWDAPVIDGHRSLDNETDASFGVAAFADPRFQPELACLLGEDLSCPAPDIVLVNSAIWDQVIHMLRFCLACGMSAAATAPASHRGRCMYERCVLLPTMLLPTVSQLMIHQQPAGPGAPPEHERNEDV